MKKNKNLAAVKNERLDQRLCCTRPALAVALYLFCYFDVDFTGRVLHIIIMRLDFSQLL